MEKKSTDGQEQLENGRFIPKLRRTIRKYKSRIIFILILILIPLKIYMPPMSDILPDADSIEYENLAVYLGVYVIVQLILGVLILLLIILLIISLRKKSTDDQEQLENDEVKRSFKFKLLRIGFRIEPWLALVSFPMYFISEISDAGPLKFLLRLPSQIAVVIYCLIFPYDDVVNDDGKNKFLRNKKAPAFYTGFFHFTAVIVLLLGVIPTTMNLASSFDPQSIELTHLSVEYRKVTYFTEDDTTSHSYKRTLSGVDSSGKQRELIIDVDDWKCLEEKGTLYQESEDYESIEFDDDVRLIGHYVPGWIVGGTLVDFEITE